MTQLHGRSCVPANAYERGQRAKRKGKLLEQNPFARRPQSKSNVRKTNDWALGWHSVDEVAVRSFSEFVWPPLKPFPHPPAGDYDRRERGLVSLFRPQDAIEWDLLRAEMSAGLVEHVPEWARIPFDVLQAYVDTRGGTLGEPELNYDIPQMGHPCKYLWSAIRFQGGGAHWPPLVVSAYEELMDGTVS